MSLAAKLPYDHAYAGGFPGLGAQPLPQDADCLDYLGRMAVADGAGVEVSVANAVDAFISGAKDAGVWDSIRASCVLAGARTLAGALVPLRDYGPELWTEQSPEIVNDASSCGSWDAATLTMTNSCVGSSGAHPLFQFNMGLSAAKSYTVLGRLSGDTSHIHSVWLGTATQLSYDKATGVISGTATPSGAASSKLLFYYNTTAAPTAVTIESLSVREVIAAPTNVANGFVEGDYSRTAGLTGDGATTYLDSGRNNNADPQDSVHHSIWVSAQGLAVSVPIGAGFNLTGATRCAVSFGTSVVTPRIRESAAQPGISDAPLSGSFFGYRRSAAAASLTRINGSDYARTTTSEVPFDGNVFVFADNNNGSPTAYTGATLAFYSIGTSLSLEDLDTSVTDLMNRIRFALVTGENPAGLDPATIDYVLRGYDAGGTLA